jgi:DNA-binding transcriptional ArsR family regulator
MAKKAGNKKASKRTSETGTPSLISPSLEKAIRTFAQVFKLLGDDTKLRTLFCLAQNRELNVTALCNRLGQKQSPMSNSLSLLLLSDLVDRRREGKRTYYKREY